MIDISSTMIELSNDRATQEEVQDVARCTPPPWAAWKGTVCLA